MYTNSSPTISIIIPNYNGAKYIKETIDSVLSQSYPCLEAIVVDDGSIDASIEILMEYNDSRLSLYSRGENYPKGANACRNIGIEKAQGEYLIFLDSDDLLDKNCLKYRVAYMNTHKELYFAVFHSIKFWGNVGNGERFTRLSGYNPIRNFLCLSPIWQTSSVIWRKDFVESIGGFNYNYQRFQDPEMTLRGLLASNNNYKLVNDSVPDMYYRRPPRLSKDKLVFSYRSMFRFIHDFYNEQYKGYIEKNDAHLMFYYLSNLHLRFCEQDNDKHQYQSCVVNLAFFASDIKSTIVYKVCSNERLFSFLKKSFFFKTYVRAKASWYRYMLKF